MPVSRDADKKLLGQKVRGLLDSHRVTTSTIGKYLGITKQSVLNKIAGRTEWTYIEIQYIARFFKLQPSYFELKQKAREVEQKMQVINQAFNAIREGRFP